MSASFKIQLHKILLYLQTNFWPVPTKEGGKAVLAGLAPSGQSLGFLFRTPWPEKLDGKIWQVSLVNSLQLSTLCCEAASKYGSPVGKALSEWNGIPNSPIWTFNFFHQLIILKSLCGYPYKRRYPKGVGYLNKSSLKPDQVLVVWCVNFWQELFTSLGLGSPSLKSRPRSEGGDPVGQGKNEKI